MTTEDAENLVKHVLKLRQRGVEEEGVIEDLMNYANSEDDCRMAIEMINTAAFRAGIISGGKNYPGGNSIENCHPIFKAAFKLAWIDFKGEEHFNKNYLRVYQNKKTKKVRKGFWDWIKGN